MKSVLCLRLLVASLFLSILVPSLCYSQTHAQMDSLYAVMQRDIQREHPTALFPAIPYDKYDTISAEFGEGRMDRSLRVVGDFYEECMFIYPEFETWDIYSEETQNDPTYQFYVVVSFYLLDPETDTLLAGRGSKILNRKEKKKKNSPDEYEPLDPEGTAIFTEPTQIDSYSCEALRNCLPVDDPIFDLATQYCTGEEEEYEEGYDEE